MNSAGPKEVLVSFFERLSKKDLTGAGELATKESQTTISMMKTAFEMAEKYKDLADKKETDDMAEDFKHVEFGDAVITGDAAVVPVKDTKNNKSFDVPLKKEEGGWKVDFSPATVQKIARDNAEPGDDSMENMDPEAMKRSMEMADSLMKNMDPEKMKEMQESLQKLQEMQKLK